MTTTSPVTGEADDAGGWEALKPAADELAADLDHDAGRLVRTQLNAGGGKLGKRYASRHGREDCDSAAMSPYGEARLLRVRSSAAPGTFYTPE